MKDMQRGFWVGVVLVGRSEMRHTSYVGASCFGRLCSCVDRQGVKVPVMKEWRLERLCISTAIARRYKVPELVPVRYCKLTGRILEIDLGEITNGPVSVEDGTLIEDDELRRLLP
jgi:hypothetical protein